MRTLLFAAAAMLSLGMGAAFAQPAYHAQQHTQTQQNNNSPYAYRWDIPGG